MIRCRFAPSPTGHLHVGGVRTALFNWLFARSQNGKYILRIEDTDVERSQEVFQEEIFRSLRWCGLDWDEGPEIGGEYGPYRQGERSANGIYMEFARDLVRNRRAYYAEYDKSDFSTVLRTSYDEPAKNNDDNVWTIKMKVPISGVTAFEDLLKGNIEFRNDILEDFVIIKSSGFPTYNFAVVVDDHMMEISHVLRGEDHISNTPKQQIIYDALGLTPPGFMHIPLILGYDRAPLSKRHGTTSVRHFRDQGYLSRALMNYLALLGWAIDEEIFDYHDKVKDFDPGSISNKPVVFDYEKLEWINGKHLRLLNPSELLGEFNSWLNNTSRTQLLEQLQNEPAFSEQVLLMCREKVNTFHQLFEFALPFFDDDLEYEANYVEKFLGQTWTEDLIESAIRRFQENLDWSIEGTEKVIRDIAEEKHTSKKNTFQTLRGAVTGRLVTPGLFETYSALGRERVLHRLNNLLDINEELSHEARP